MGNFPRGILKITAFIALSFAILVTLPRLSPILYPPLPAPSATFDCDDGTLNMYRHFQRLGVEASPIVGNLGMDGEEYMECDHVWLMVGSGDKGIAYDWGEPQFDNQHYEGYIISFDDLLYAVAEDRKVSDILTSVDY